MLGHVLIYLAGCLTCYLPLCTVYHWLFLLLCNLDRVGNILNMLLHHTMHARFEPIKWQSHFIFFVNLMTSSWSSFFIFKVWDHIFMGPAFFIVLMVYSLLCLIWKDPSSHTTERKDFVCLCSSLYIKSLVFMLLYSSLTCAISSIFSGSCPSYLYTRPSHPRWFPGRTHGCHARPKHLLFLLSRSPTHYS